MGKAGSRGNKSIIYKITTTGMLLALGIILPILFHVFSISGLIFLPMHIPVLICGLLCGWQYGMVIGLILPFAANLISGAPPIYPTAISMAFELMAYGVVIALAFKLFQKIMRNEFAYIVSLIIALVGGRIVLAIANIILLNLQGNTYTIEAFISAAFVTAIPGIIIQLIFIPVLMVILDKSGFVRKFL